ncbi:MAG: FHA domain-containing protein, partial [Myxococcota bacterium]|nr:FHA domain-containing protein [Myxococcota bacterium]
RIGRTEENEITIPHSSISRHHAQLKRQDDGSYILSDSQSSNGTRARGKRVHRGVRVFHGDQLTFGQIDCLLADPQGRQKKKQVDFLQLFAWALILSLVVVLGIYFGASLRG